MYFDVCLKKDKIVFRFDLMTKFTQTFFIGPIDRETGISVFSVCKLW